MTAAQLLPPHSPAGVRRVSVVDSHTGGEPTRVVLEGGPELAGRTVAEKRDDFAARYDDFRAAVAEEPRGSDVMVGALLVPPADPSRTAGVIFFNNAGMLGMCGHGTIGLIVTLAHLGRITPGAHRIETPVGVVTAHLHDDGSVSVQNVPAYRHQKAVSVTLASGQVVTGDVAWGGNWFFLCDDHGQTLNLELVEELTEFTWQVRQALNQNGITGANGAEIDHIELFVLSVTPGINSQNFVLCPGKAYDRSPCGTGTSAKLACLAADGKLREGEIWRQESIIGSVFEGSYRQEGNALLPTIRGRAWVNAESTLLLDATDPYCSGIRQR